MTAAAICISGRQHRVGKYMHLDASKFMKQLADEGLPLSSSKGQSGQGYGDRCSAGRGASSREDDGGA